MLQNKLLVILLLGFVSVALFAQGVPPAATPSIQPTPSVPSDNAKPVDTKAVEKEVNVVLGIDYVERFDFVPHTKVEVGNEAILSYSLLPQKKEIVLRGVKPGQTSVTLRDSGGDTRLVIIAKITQTAQSKVVSELKEFIGDVEGLVIGMKGDKVFVGGEIVVPADIGRVAVILADPTYKDVLRLIEVSPQTQVMIANRMQDAIQKNGMKTVTVRVVNKIFWLEGVVDSPSKKDLARNIAKAYLPDNIQSLGMQTGSLQAAPDKSIIQDFIAINEKDSPKPVPKMVKITAQFVELTKDYSKVFGFKWTPIMAGDGGSINIGRSGSGGVTTQSNGTLAATISNLFPKLASGKSAGQVRVMQSGVVIVEEKVKAHLEKTSKQPYTMGTGDFTKSEAANAGFLIDVTPTTMQEEKVKMDLGITVSMASGTTPPMETKNVLNTSVVVKSKESAAIGGVVINKTSTDYDKDPPFGKDAYTSAFPIFSFLRSKSYATSKSQFVVFVTPEIIESVTSGTEDIKRKFRRRSR